MSQGDHTFNYFEDYFAFPTIEVLPNKRFRPRESSGYPINRFVDAISDDFICKVCENVVKKPLECTNCGNLICWGCNTVINRSYNGLEVFRLERQSNCPVCSTINTLRNPSRVLMRIIHELKVMCKNKKRGCEEKFALGDLKAHESSCPYKIIKCGNMRICNNRGTAKAFIPVEIDPSLHTYLNRVSANYACSEICKKVMVFDRLIANGKIENALQDYFKVLTDIENEVC